MTIPRTIPAGVETISGYPIPSGGATDAGGPAADTGGTGDGGTTADTGTGPGTETDGTDRKADEQTDATDTDGKPDPGRAGGEEALRADLARERQRRKAAERERDDARRTTESEAETREREIREQVQGPAIRALRVTAVEMAAREAGFVYPEDAYRLLTDAERDGLDVDLEDEIPTADRAEAAKLVKALAKRRPALLTPATGGEQDTRGTGGSDTQAGGTRQSSRTSSDPNATLRGLFRQKLGTPSG